MRCSLLPFGEGCVSGRGLALFQSIACRYHRQFLLACLTRYPKATVAFTFFRSFMQRRTAMSNGNKPPKEPKDTKDQGKGQDPKQSGSK